jgi:hypothetical protein
MDKQHRAHMLNSLGSVAYSEGDLLEARSYYKRSLALYRDVKDTASVGWAFHCLANVAYSDGDHPAARLLLRQGLAPYRKLGRKVGMALILLTLAAITISDALQAKEQAQKSAEAEGAANVKRLELAEQGTKILGAAIGLLLASGAMLSPVAAMLGSVQDLIAASGAGLDPIDRSIYEHTVASARSILGEQAFEDAIQEGRGMDLQKALAFVFERKE